MATTIPKNFNYTYENMVVLKGKEEIKKAYDDGFTLYRLYPDDTESEITYEEALKEIPDCLIAYDKTQYKTTNFEIILEYDNFEVWKQDNTFIGIDLDEEKIYQVEEVDREIDSDFSGEEMYSENMRHFKIIPNTEFAPLDNIKQRWENSKLKLRIEYAKPINNIVYIKNIHMERK